MKQICILILLNFTLLHSCKAKSETQVATIDTTTIMQKDSNTTQTGKYNTRIKLKYRNVLEFDDGLRIQLTMFGHKNSVDGTSVKVNAELVIAESNNEKNAYTAVYKEEYTNEQGAATITYESTTWGNYKVELIALSYEESIDINVSKIEDTKQSKGDNLQKGQITGKIIELPNKEKIESITISLSPDPDIGYTKHLDSLGNFNSGILNYGTYTLKIFNEESHYPILIKNVVLKDEQLDLGELPLFRDPYGYQAEWGADANGDNPFHHRHPILKKQRDSLEAEYQMLFKNQFEGKKLNFETIDTDTNPNDNTINLWRFSVIENSKQQ